MQHRSIKNRLKERGWYDKTNPWAKVEREFICSEALLMLSATAIRVYLRMMIKKPHRKLENGKKRGKKAEYIYDNGPIIFTYAESECFGIPRSSFARAIRELIEKGFIKILHQGGTVGNGRDWTTYELIDDWKLYGTPAFVSRTKKSIPTYSHSLRKHNENKRKKPKPKTVPPTAKNDTSEVPRMTLETE